MRKIKIILRRVFDWGLNKYSPKLFVKVKLKRAVNLAKTKWILTGKRHYVIPIDNEFVVINNAIIKNKKLQNGKKWNAIDLLEMAVYVTPVSTYHNI